jgi:hypothetical protein
LSHRVIDFTGERAYKRVCPKAPLPTSRDAIAISLSISAILHRESLMNAQSKDSTVAKVVLFLSLAFLASIYLINGALAPSVAQSTEREFEDRVPKHLPIKVKLKKEKEKAVKDLNNEKWVRDFQLEITNTGTKPIYFLDMILIMPGIIAPNGIGMSFTIQYGRGELLKIETKAGPDDVPIMPGETYVFNFSDLAVKGWENFRQRENKPDAKKLILDFQILSFGDGTGFFRKDGIAIPQAPSAKSGLNGCEPKPNLSDSSGVQGHHSSRRRWPAIFPVNSLPAENLLANFLSPEASEEASLKLKSQSQLCCSGNNCFRSKPDTNNCLCGGTRLGIVEAACSDPRGSCNSVEYFYDACDGGYCLRVEINPCGGNTAPTPTPTPTPSPTPTPDCDPNTKPNPHCVCTSLGGAPVWQCLPCAEARVRILLNTRPAVPAICITIISAASA